MDGTSDTVRALRELRGNEPLVLDDPAAGWLIEQGSVALFAVAQAGGVPGARRRFFFRCPAGAALFGLPVEAGSERPVVVAVALEPTILRQVGVATDDGLARDWIRRWRAVLADRLPPARAADGAADSLPLFHAALVACIDEACTRQSHDEQAELVEAERRAEEAAQSALDALTSVVAPHAAPAPQGSELYRAAAAVAGAMGITLCRPAEWELGRSAVEPVEAIARASRVRARRVLLDDRWWCEDCGPLLATSRQDGRPLALLPGRRGRYELFDPTTRVRRPVDAALAATLEARAWVFYRPLPERVVRGVDLARFALGGRARDLAAIAGAAIAATLLGMVVPQATALLVDHAIPDADWTLLYWLGGGLLAAALGAAAFRLSQGIVTTRLESGADAATQAAVWDRLLSLQLSFFRRFATGDLQSRVTAVSQIRGYLGGTTLRTLFSSVIALLNLALLFHYSPLLTVLALGVAAVSAAVSVASGALLVRLARRVMELRGRFFGLMVQLVNGIAKLRVAAAEERAFARWAQDYAELLRLELKQRRLQDTVQLLNIGLATASGIALFGAAATLIAGPAEEGVMSTGTFLAFNVAFGTFIAAAVSLSNTVGDVLTVAMLYARARPILETLPEATQRKVDPGPLAGHVELDQVSFQYHEQGPPILQAASLRVEPGQFVAIVGPSGGGKSTLFRLLLGFETPGAGVITYDGQDLAGLDIHAVRRQLGVVLQTGRINAGSIFENIVCGSQLTLNQALEAAAAVGFADEIAAMPMGLHTVISEGGTNLSGGQRQRLLLARAVVRQPRILLLDEATSALDNRTQAIVGLSLERLDITRIVIAHRLSTIRRADRIYVIDAGRIVEQGAFDELAAAGGIFARLMARQLG